MPVSFHKIIGTSLYFSRRSVTHSIITHWRWTRQGILYRLQAFCFCYKSLGAAPVPRTVPEKPAGRTGSIGSQHQRSSRSGSLIDWLHNPFVYWVYTSISYYIDHVYCIDIHLFSTQGEAINLDGIHPWACTMKAFMSNQVLKIIVLIAFLLKNFKKMQKREEKFRGNSQWVKMKIVI